METLEKFYNYFDLEISACPGKRADFIQAMRDDLKPCKVVSVKEIFSEDEIYLIKSLINPKECFKNAYQVAMILGTAEQPIKYVEGRALAAKFLPIEHAWNRIGDKYFDVTFELVLGYDVNEEEYATLREYDVDYVTKVLLEREYWGEIYREEKFEEFNKNC